MRIVEISQFYHPYKGGQEAYVRNLSRALVAQGHEVTVITTSPAGDTDLRDSGIRLIRHPTRLTLLNNPITLAALRERKVIQAAEIIHLHNDHSFLSLSAALLARRKHAPLVVTLHGQLKFGSAPLDFVERAYTKSLGNLLLKRVDKVFANSEEDRLAALKRGVPPSKVVQVWNAVDETTLGRYVGLVTRSQVLARLGLGEDRRIVLYVGRLIERKGIRTLVGAFRHSLSEVPEAHLVLVGDGPLRPYCERAAAVDKLRGHVEILTQIPDSFLYACYQAADVLVLPSISESCPTVVLEALFFGCEVITTDIPGIRDHFAGLASLVPPRDSKSLAREISNFLRRARRATGSLSQPQMLIRRKYNWTTVADMYTSAFEKLGREDGPTGGGGHGKR